MKDTDLMPFGKYRNERMIDVPAHYLLWMYESDDFELREPVLSYVEENLKVLKMEVKNGKQKRKSN